MNKDVLNYCKTLSQVNTEHIENAKENLRLLQEGRFEQLNGCPQNYGATNFVGFCELKEVSQSEQNQQCLNCWKAAMQV